MSKKPCYLILYSSDDELQVGERGLVVCNGDEELSQEISYMMHENEENGITLDDIVIFRRDDTIKLTSKLVEKTISVQEIILHRKVKGKASITSISALSLVK